MDQTSVISLDTIKFLTSDGLKLFTNNILSIIEDNEYVTATAITDLNDRLLIVENKSDSIITEADITAWGFTKNTGTITGVKANGTSVATSGVANIPAASTSAYGVTKLSDATNSSSTTLAATANAVKQAYDLANGKGTYSKPSGGIPKSDLASAVQTSLSKADTALQSYTEQYKGTITGVSANGTSVATSGVANIPAASTSAYGVTKLSSATNSTSTVLAATASAVKAAYDLANSYKGTVTSITINGTTKNPTNGVIDLGNIPTEDSINNILTIIEDNEYVTATAITDLNDRLLIVENKSDSIITEDTILSWGFTKNTGTYSKPSGGIPKSDLASAVQTSLGKADTALQSYTEQYKGTITGVSANGTSVATSGVANIPAASTSKYGVTKLSDSTTSTSTVLAATANAVRQAYDLANTYKGTVTSITINSTTKNPTNGVIDLGTIPTEDSINNILTIIEDNEYVTATAITDLNDRVTNLELNGVSEKAIEAAVVNVSDMLPNTIYYGNTNVASVTIASFTVSNSFIDEYMLVGKYFYDGSGDDPIPMPITLPSDVRWVNGVIPEINNGEEFELSITRRGTSYKAVLTTFKIVE